MSLLSVGETAPPVPGFERGALWFYKVTCPVCQMVAPKIELVSQAFPGLALGVGQDPPDALAAFGLEQGTGILAIPDLPPYELSDAFGVAVVPTLLVVGPDGIVLEVVESWDREGYNRAADVLGRLSGLEPIVVSDERDGLPPFRPG